MILCRQLLILFFFMLLGFGMAKRKILDQHNSGFLSWLIVNVANPALILSGAIGNSIDRRELFKVVLVAAGVYLFLIVVSEMAVKLLGVDRKETGIYKVLLIFTNMGFMGFPLLDAMYGAEALLYGAVFLLLFNLLIYTYGIFRIAGAAGSPAEIPAEILKKFVNPGVAAGVLAIMLAFLRVELPGSVNQTVSMLSNLTAPLSMMVIGASLLEVQWKGFLRDIRLLIFVVLRLVIIPVLGMLILRNFVSNQYLLGACFVTLAAPSGSMAAMLARQYRADYVTASKGIGLTTLLSVITMPLLFWVFQLR